MSTENSDTNKFDYDGTVEKIKNIQNQNIGKIQALARAGKTIDPGALANIKIDTFVEMFLSQDAKAAYVLAMETNFQAALDEGLAMIRQEQLTEGTPGQQNKLIIPR